MDNGFNKARPKKENPSLQRIQTSGDPFGAKSYTRKTSTSAALTVKPAPVIKPALEPEPKPAPKSEPALAQPPDKSSSSSDKTTSLPNKAASLPAKKRKTSKKPLYLAIVFAPVTIVLITTAILIFSSNKVDEPKKEPEEKNTPTVVEKTYPKETATMIDVTVAETEIQITESSHYVLSGETKYPIIVNAPGEVVIYLNGISVAPVGATALANLSEHPLTLILEDNTTTNLQTNNSDANAVYSEGDLTVKGNGILNVTGIDVKAGHEFKKEATVNNLKSN